VSGIGLPDILVPARFCPTVITPNRFWCGRVRKASKKNVKSLRQESYTMKSLETVKEKEIPHPRYWYTSNSRRSQDCESTHH